MIALRVEASNSVFRSKRMNTGTVCKPFWAFVTSETKEIFFSYSPRIRGLNELLKAFCWFSCKGSHDPTLGIKLSRASLS